MIFGYGFVNLSDRSLKENVRAIPAEELQRTFDAVEPQIFDRIGGGKDQVGFIAQDVQASGPLGETMRKVKNLDGRELMALALDYQKLPASSSRSPGESSRIGGTSRPEHERAEQARTGGHGRVDLGNEFRGAARQKDLRPERHGGGGPGHPDSQEGPHGQGGPARRRLGRPRGRGGGYNARPHQAVTVAPEDVETKPAASFCVYQDNARKLQAADGGPAAAARGGGGLPGPTNAARSFQPQYGAATARETR